MGVSAGSRKTRQGESYRIPDNLDKHICDHERLPRVRLGRSLTGLVKGPLLTEYWKDLFDNLRKNQKEQKSTKHLILKSSYGIFAVQDGDADEQGLVVLALLSKAVKGDKVLTAPADKVNLEYK